VRAVRGIRVVAAALVLAGATAACGGAQPATGTPHGQLPSSATPTPSVPAVADPTGSAPTTPDPGSPTPASSANSSPTLIKATGSFSPALVQSAYQTVRDFFAAEDYAFASLDTRRFDNVVETSCPCSKALHDQVSAYRKKRWHLRGGTVLNITTADFASPGGQIATVSVTNRINSGDVVDQSGSVQEHQPAYGRWQETFNLLLTRGTWKVGAITVIEQGSPLP
jgi:hypothetical protein